MTRITLSYAVVIVQIICELLEVTQSIVLRKLRVIRKKKACVASSFSRHSPLFSGEIHNVFMSFFHVSVYISDYFRIFAILKSTWVAMAIHR